MDSAVAAFAFPLPEAAQEVGIRLHGLRDRFTATRRKRQTSEKLARLCEYNPLVLETANQFLAEPIQLDGPNYVVPQRPGLGAVLDEDAVARSRVGEQLAA